MLHSRNATFSPTVTLTFDKKGKATGIEWDWDDSYQLTVLDHGEFSVEIHEDEDACFVLDDLIIDNAEDMRWV